jgi:hypothetical protein
VPFSEFINIGFRCLLCLGSRQSQFPVASTSAPYLVIQLETRETAQEDGFALKLRLKFQLAMSRRNGMGRVLSPGSSHTVIFQGGLRIQAEQTDQEAAFSCRSLDTVRALQQTVTLLPYPAFQVSRMINGRPERSCPVCMFKCSLE